MPSTTFQFLYIREKIPSVACVLVIERLDATLDNYELEGRKPPEQSSRTSQEPLFVSSLSLPSFVVQPVATDGLVNGTGAQNATFITHVDLHHEPDVTHDVAAQQLTTSASVLDEPEPDYDTKDDENEGHIPPPMEVSRPPTLAEPPTPPPLPPPSSIGFSAGLEMTHTSRSQSTERREPADVVAARKRDEAHAALIAAVQRRRHLLDSVDGDLIVDNIENRVQRSKMLQTVYRADHGAAPVQLGRSDESTVEHQTVGLLAVVDSPSTTTSNGDFLSEAERARLEYVRRLHPPPPPPPPPPVKQRPPTKPLRSQPPTAPKSSQNGGVLRPAEPPPVLPRRSVVVNESHNRALVEYVNGSSKVYTATAGTTSGDAGNATARSFVRLHDVGESTTEPSPVTPATADERRLRVVTDDTASVLSSLSTLSSTNSSVGVGGVGGSNGAVSPHGSPSHSSSGDSGFVKSTTSGSGSAVVADQPIIPPPMEFASPSENSSSSSSSASVQTTVPVAGLRSVAKRQSHSMVFPARTQITQK